jgi:microcystin-dependent protein
MSENNAGNGKRKILTITPEELLHPLTRRDLLRRAALSGSALLLSGIAACRDFNESPTEPSTLDPKAKPQTQSTMTNNPFMGEIALFSFNFAPRGWMFCNGQLLSISQNTALFSLFTTSFGGNGTTQFALPDLRSRTPIHLGQGPGLVNNYIVGQKGGAESHTVTTPQMPAHSHPFNASVAGGNIPTPLAHVLASANNLFVPDIIDDPDNERARALAATTRPAMYSSGTVLTSLYPSTVLTVGGSQPHENRQPFTALNFCIAVQGMYPS